VFGGMAMASMPPLVVGMTGSFGSGCTFVARKYFAAKNFEIISLTDVLRAEAEKLDLRIMREGDRHELQGIGNKIRELKGPRFLAERVREHISGHPTKPRWVVDSIRNPHEVAVLREGFPQFYLCSVAADVDVRWKRVKDRYSRNLAVFEEDDGRDAHEDLDFGQRVRECCSLADIVISNDTDYDDGNLDQAAHQAEVTRYISLIEGSVAFTPAPEEAHMVMAYSISRRSSCLKRKVGAIITGALGSVIGSGCNEVPRQLRTCRELVGRCYRDKLSDDFVKDLKKIITQGEDLKSIVDLTDKTFKNLDHCRALHAEENAILSVVGHGASISLSGSTLYTTTYPCNLCANKIAQVGITQICYMEPYPMREAKEVLTEKKVAQRPFSGVTPRGYFKLDGGA